MRIPKKNLLLTLLSLGALSFVLFFAISKSTTVKIESKLGKFCIECKAYQKGSGISTYGFGLAFCDNKINEMANTIESDEMNNYKSHLNDKGFIEIVNLLAEIESNLKSNNTKGYVYSVIAYRKQINELDAKQKEDVLSFFEN
ncbi:MAG: hypothetical protein ACQESK_09725 [Bacteroidota bacterium]